MGRPNRPSVYRYHRLEDVPSRVPYEAMPAPPKKTPGLFARLWAKFARAKVGKQAGECREAS